VTTSTDLDAREIVSAVYEAVARQDMETFASLLAEDVVLVEPDGHPYPGTWHGHADVVEALPSILGAIRMTKIEVKQIIAEGDTALGIIQIVSTNAAGRDLVMPMIEKWVVRNGKVVHVEPYYHDTATLVAHLSET
jgi:ketosteroid isomerase-like protein